MYYDKNCHHCQSQSTQAALISNRKKRVNIHTCVVSSFHKDRPHHWCPMHPSLTYNPRVLTWCLSVYSVVHTVCVVRTIPAFNLNPFKIKLILILIDKTRVAHKSCVVNTLLIYKIMF